MTDQAAMPGNPAGRVLLLADASRPSLAALEAAVDLAVHRRAELHAVFVEETALLRGAGFAFAREVGALSGTTRPIEASAVEARLRRQAERVRLALEEAVAGRGISHSLSVRRGNVLREVLTLAGPHDLLVLGRIGWSAIPGRGLGSTARALLRQAPGSLLLWTVNPRHLEGSVVAWVDNAEAATDILAEAAATARHRRRPLTVLLPTPDSGTSPATRDRTVADWLARTGVDATVRKLPALDPTTVARTLRAERCAELLISRRSRLMTGLAAEATLDTLNLPVTVLP